MQKQQSQRTEQSLTEICYGHLLRAGGKEDLPTTRCRDCTYQPDGGNRDCVFYRPVYVNSEGLRRVRDIRVRFKKPKDI